MRLIGRLVARLDGLPLAIELAAARAGSMGLDQLASLDDRNSAITQRSRSSRDRHQTMAATIDWSYQLLPVDLRVVLRRLSVFVGGFDLDAATVVTSSQGEPVRDLVGALSALVEWSLLGFTAARTTETVLGRSRYAMLETFRQFAMSRLDAEDGPAGVLSVRDAHSAYFAEVSSQASGALVGRQQGRWLTALEIEHANISAALAYLLDRPGRACDAVRMIVHLKRFWMYRGHQAECATLLGQALDRVTGVM
jgi:predicted ATPase